VGGPGPLPDGPGNPQPPTIIGCVPVVMGGGTAVHTLLSSMGNGSTVGIVQIVLARIAGPTGVTPG
jgi:hypothetical protein